MQKISIIAVGGTIDKIYFAMNGRIFTADHVRKNLEKNRFEEI